MNTLMIPLKFAFKKLKKEVIIPPKSLRNLGSIYLSMLFDEVFGVDNVISNN